MSLEQNICGYHLLLKSSFVEKEYKSLGSLITSRLGYVCDSWDCGPVNLLLGEYCCLFRYQLEEFFTSK